MTTLLLNHFFMFSFLMISAGFPQRDQCGICHENSWKNQGDPKRSFLLTAGKHLLSTQLRIWGGGCGFYYTLIIPLGPDKESMILFFFFLWFLMADALEYFKCTSEIASPKISRWWEQLWFYSFWTTKTALIPVFILSLLFPWKVSSLSAMKLPRTLTLWPSVNALFGPTVSLLFCFPCCHNISAAKSRGNQLRLRPCADPAHSSCSPQIPCAMRPVPSQPTGYLSALLVKVKHPYSDIQLTVSVYITDFPCLWQKLFRTVYHCLLLQKLPFYVLDYDCMWGYSWRL